MELYLGPNIFCLYLWNGLDFLLVSYYDVPCILTLTQDGGVPVQALKLLENVAYLRKELGAFWYFMNF